MSNTESKLLIRGMFWNMDKVQAGFLHSCQVNDMCNTYFSKFTLGSSEVTEADEIKIFVRWSLSSGRC